MLCGSLKKMYQQNNNQADSTITCKGTPQTRRSHVHTSRERERDFSDSPETDNAIHHCTKHQNKTL